MDRLTTPAPKRRWFRWSNLAFGPTPELLLLLGILIVLAVKFVSEVRSQMEERRLHDCGSHLKQISQALQAYKVKHGAFPPAYTTGADGKPLHSWRTLILPYLGHASLYEQLDLKKPWDDPVNAKAFQAHTVDVYHCPVAPFAADRTNYLAVVTPHSCLRPGQPRSIDDITDRPSDTIIVTEVAIDQSVPWMSPLDADENLAVSIGPDSKLSHKVGVGAVFADGHCSHIKTTLPFAVRRALFSIAGNDRKVLLEYDKYH